MLVFSRPYIQLMFCLHHLRVILVGLVFEVEEMAEHNEMGEDADVYMLLKDE